jgi:four helix bundle protein
MTAIQPQSSIELWHGAVAIARAVHLMTAAFPRRELFGLSLQLRRASLDLAAHVAEGSAGKSTDELVAHIKAARTAYVELNTQLLITEQFGLLGEHSELKTKLQTLGDKIQSTALELRERQRRIAVQRAALSR